MNLTTKILMGLGAGAGILFLLARRGSSTPAAGEISRFPSVLGHPIDPPEAEQTMFIAFSAEQTSPTDEQTRTMLSDIGYATRQMAPDNYGKRVWLEIHTYAQTLEKSREMAVNVASRLDDAFLHTANLDHVYAHSTDDSTLGVFFWVTMR
jgi:hypothetical protein